MLSPNIRELPSGSLVLVSPTADYAVLSKEDASTLIETPDSLSLSQRAWFQARGFLQPIGPSEGQRWLLASRRRTKNETVIDDPAFHEIVTSLFCHQSCSYCQVSRRTSPIGATISLDDIERIVETIFSSQSEVLTIEFQGGEPLLQFDLVKHAISRIAERNLGEKRKVRFVVATTLHQLTREHCGFFKDHDVFLSTSIDGPEELHNLNRALPTRDSYQRTINGVELARTLLGADKVAALMTTTRHSLQFASEIVDEYVRLGFNEIFIRPLSPFGFAFKNRERLSYSIEEFINFYKKALDRVLYWNRNGYSLREAYAAITLNRILSPFDDGFVDLQCSSLGGIPSLIYNYDGYIYPSDEARMLAEMGHTQFRIGKFGMNLKEIRASESISQFRAAAERSAETDCNSCPYSAYCGPSPVDSQAEHGVMDAPARLTQHCNRSLAMFDEFMMRLTAATPHDLDIFYSWALPPRN